MTHIEIMHTNPSGCIIRDHTSGNLQPGPEKGVFIRTLKLKNGENVIIKINLNAVINDNRELLAAGVN